MSTRILTDMKQFAKQNKNSILLEQLWFYDSNVKTWEQCLIDTIKKMTIENIKLQQTVTKVVQLAGAVAEYDCILDIEAPKRRKTDV